MLISVPVRLGSGDSMTLKKSKVVFFLKKKDSLKVRMSKFKSTYNLELRDISWFFLRNTKQN